MRGIFTAFFKKLFTPSLFLIPPREVRPQTEDYTWKNVAMVGGGFVSGILTSRTDQNLMYGRTDLGRAYHLPAAIYLIEWVEHRRATILRRIVKK